MLPHPRRAAFVVLRRAEHGKPRGLLTLDAATAARAEVALQAPVSARLAACAARGRLVGFVADFPVMLASGCEPQLVDGARVRPLTAAEKASPLRMPQCVAIFDEDGRCPSNAPRADAAWPVKRERYGARVGAWRSR